LLGLDRAESPIARFAGEVLIRLWPRIAVLRQVELPEDRANVVSTVSTPFERGRSTRRRLAT
jgi:hypothetical protein